jgi:hypothetical protein
METKDAVTKRRTESGGAEKEGRRGQTRSHRGTGRGTEVKRGAAEAQGGAPRSNEEPQRCREGRRIKKRGREGGAPRTK